MSIGNYTLFTPYDMLYSPEKMLTVPKAHIPAITPKMILSDGSFRNVGSAAPKVKVIAQVKEATSQRRKR